MKVAIPSSSFFFGGGGCQRKSKPIGGSSASFKLLTTKDSYAVFLFHDPVSPSFWIRP